MAAKRKPTQPRISEESVRSKTGRGWDEWFKELDQAGASSWKHKEIAKHVLEGYGVTHWWAQTIAVSYENARGLRDKHEMPDGYQVQREKRLDATLDAVWALLTDEAKRSDWLATEAKVRSIREDKRFLRLDFPDGTRILMGCRPISDDRSVVGVQQSKLADRAAAEQAKVFWSDKLNQLADLLG